MDTALQLSPLLSEMSTIHSFSSIYFLFCPCTREVNGLHPAGLRAILERNRHTQVPSHAGGLKTQRAADSEKFL